MRIIAECGVNFRNIEEAMLMIRASKKAGCWATKFQIYNEDNLKDVEDLKVREFLRSIMLTEPDIILLHQYGHMVEQEVFFTPMYPEIIPFLETLNINYYKIRFKDHENYELINSVLNTRKPCFISVDFIPQLKTRQIIYLFCVPKYPATYEDYDIGISKLNMYNGISDHTPNLKLLKECLPDFTDDYYFEKHMCLDKNCLEAEWSVTFDELGEVLQK